MNKVQSILKFLLLIIGSSLSIPFILEISVAYAKTNYIKARLFQASTTRRPEDWMIKNYHPEPKEFQDHYQYFFRTNFTMGGNKDLGELYKDISSKNESRILDRVDQS